MMEMTTPWYLSRPDPIDRTAVDWLIHPAPCPAVEELHVSIDRADVVVNGFDEPPCHMPA